MKNLVEYIKESQEKTSEDSKKFTFTFGDLPNSKDTIKSLAELGEDHDIKVETPNETTVEITLTRDICDNHKDQIDEIRDVLQQYSELNRKDSKNASDESFAQKTHKFMDKVNDMIDFIDNKDAEEDEDDKYKDDKKSEDNDEE
jgi:metal-sulfur cluster biosynthetic enzyme